ncbi:MAG: LysR substrate-binding domain-containing protein, partial [Bradyrhizobium sp.]
ALLPLRVRWGALSRGGLAAARHDGEPKGPLSIGSMETTAAVRLPILLAEFHRRFPAVQLSLRTSTTAELVAGVLNGTFDGAFVAGPIDHAELDATVAFREELVLVTAQRWKSLSALRAGTPGSGPTALVFRTGCTYRQRLEQVFSEFGWPSSARFELGTLDGMVGCVAADMGVTLLPRAVVGRNDTVNVHTLKPAQARVETLFITRRAAHRYSALQGFASCLNDRGEVVAA